MLTYLAYTLAVVTQGDAPVPVPDMQIHPLGVFASAFGVAAFAGLASLLRSGSKVTVLSVLSAFLNSGLVGLGISLLWYHKFQDNVYFLIGVCVLAGLGGATTVDAILNAVKSGGFSIKIGKNGDAQLPGIGVSTDGEKQK